MTPSSHSYEYSTWLANKKRIDTNGAGSRVGFISSLPAGGPGGGVGVHDEGLDGGQVGILRKRRGFQQGANAQFQLCAFLEHVGEVAASAADVHQVAANRLAHRQRKTSRF